MNVLIKIQKSLLVVSSIIVLIALFFGVTLRYLFEIDLFAIDEVILIPIVILYFIGGAHGSYEKSHIRADILDSYLKSDQLKALFASIAAILTFLTCVVIVYWNLQYLIWSYNSGGKTPGWKIPLYIPHGLVFLGFVLMTLYSFIHMISEIKILFNKKEG